MCLCVFRASNRSTCINMTLFHPSEFDDANANRTHSFQVFLSNLTKSTHDHQHELRQSAAHTIRIHAHSHTATVSQHQRSAATTRTSCASRAPSPRLSLSPPCGGSHRRTSLHNTHVSNEHDNKNTGLTASDSELALLLGTIRAVLALHNSTHQPSAQGLRHTLTRSGHISLPGHCVKPARARVVSETHSTQ